MARLRPPLMVTALLAGLALSAPALSRDSLGVFAAWGAFRDPAVPRCYAIAMAETSKSERTTQPFASVGTWPRQKLRGQIHFRLSRAVAAGGEVRLALGNQRFVLKGNGSDAWAQDARMDAAIVAAMRSAAKLSVSARDSQGRLFTDSYSLEGAATAMDAATVGCARLR